MANCPNFNTELIPQWCVSSEEHVAGCLIQPGRQSHNGDVIMGLMASQITSFTIVYSTVIQAQIKENIKAPRHRPLCGKFTGHRWIPRTNGQ